MTRFSDKSLAASFERFVALKSMNTIIQMANHENAYLSWIEIIPDEVSDEDLMDIASSDAEIYRDACREFKRLMKSDEIIYGGLTIGGDVY